MRSNMSSTSGMFGSFLAGVSHWLILPSFHGPVLAIGRIQSAREGLGSPAEDGALNITGFNAAWPETPSSSPNLIQ